MRLSALVVTFNDEKHLQECLQSLAPCSQVQVVDLGSTDSTVRIAESYAFQVIRHDWVPIGEFVLPDVLDMLQTDWFIRVDPDEVLPEPLFRAIEECIENRPDAAIITIPFEYYFLGKPLRTTVWGGVRNFPKVLNRNRIMLPKGVHSTFEPREKFVVTDIQATRDNVVKHYWIDSYSQMFEKHRRYLGLEGQAKYGRGERFSWGGMARAVLLGLRESMVCKSGWRGGWAGWFLSAFYVTYVAGSWLSLRTHQDSLLGQ